MALSPTPDATKCCLVVGHQFKSPQFAGLFRVEPLLKGADGLLRPLTAAWQLLKAREPGSVPTFGRKLSLTRAVVTREGQ
jgi:hypothetical protein